MHQFRALLLPSPNWYNSGVSKISPNGEYFVYASKNNIVVLRTSDMGLHALLSGHPWRVHCVCFDREGLLNSLSKDQTLKRWDPATWRCIKTFKGKKSSDLILMDSLDKTDALVLGDKLGGVWIWKYTSSAPLNCTPISVQFVYDLGEGLCKLKTKVGASVSSLSSVPNSGSLSIIGCEDGSAFLIDVVTDYCVKKIGSMRGAIQCIQWTSTITPRVNVDLTTPSIPTSNKPHLDVSLTISDSPQECHILALGFVDGCVEFWSYDVEDFCLLQTVQIPSDKKSGYHTSAWNVCKVIKHETSNSQTPGHTLTLLASFHTTIYSWNIRFDHCWSKVVEMSPPISLPKSHSRVIFSMDIILNDDPASSSSSLHFITTSMDRRILQWKLETNNLKSAKVISSMDCLGGDVLSMDLTRSNYLAIGSADKAVRVLDLESLDSGGLTQVKMKWRGITHQVSLVKWSPDHHCLAFVCKDRTLGLFGEKDKYYIYPTKTKNQVLGIQWRPLPSGFTPDLQLIVLESTGALLCYPMIHRSEFLDSHDEAKRGHQQGSSNLEQRPFNLTARIQGLTSGDKVSAFLINSSGRHLIAGTRTGQIIVCELIDRFEDSVLLNTFEVFSNTNGIRFLEWNRNENRILAIAENGSLAVMYWNGEDRISVSSRLNQSAIDAAHWSHSHSSIIYTLQDNKQIKLWDVNNYSPVLVLDFGSFQDQNLTQIAVHPQKQDTLLLASANPCLIEQTHQEVESIAQCPTQIPHASNESSIKVKFDYLNGDRVMLEFVIKLPSTKKKPQQKQHPIRLKNRPLISFQKPPRNIKDSIDKIPLLLNSDSEIGSLQALWKDLQSLGLHKTPNQATKTVKAQIKETDSPEMKAMKLLWIQDYTQAAETLFSHDAMTGEFLPFFIPGGRQFYSSVVQQYAQFLESKNEPHLASMHFLTLGEISKAVEVYQKAALYDDGICLASLKFLKEDTPMQNAFWKRAIGAKNQTPLTSALDMLLANKPKDAIQVLLNAHEGELDLVGAKILASLMKKGLLEEDWDAGFMITVLRRALVHCTVSNASNEDSQLVRGLILRAKTTQLCNGDVLFCDVLGEVLSGHFTDLLSNLEKHRTQKSEIFNAGLTALVSFERFYELMDSRHRPQIQSLITDLDQMMLTLQEQSWTDAFDHANEICRWFLFELFGVDEEAKASQNRLRKSIGSTSKDNIELELQQQDSETALFAVDKNRSIRRYSRSQLLKLQTDPETDRQILESFEIPKAARVRKLDLRKGGKL